MNKTIIAIAVVLAGCTNPPDQPALQTYGTGTPTCLLFCTANAIFADIAESASLTTTGGSKTATGGTN